MKTNKDLAKAMSSFCKRIVYSNTAVKAVTTSQGKVMLGTVISLLSVVFLEGGIDPAQLWVRPGT